MSSNTERKLIVTLNTFFDKYYCVNSNITFGEIVAEKRRQKGLSQRTLAQLVKRSPTYISYIERNFNPASKNNTSKPTVEVVDSIAKVLEWSIDEARLAAGYAPSVSPEVKSYNNEFESLLDELRQMYQLSAKESDDPEQAQENLIHDLRIATRVIIESNKPKMRQRKVSNK